MENGWQMKCGLKSPCSSTSLPSSSEQLQLQDARNQMNMNISHCILPHDAPGPFPPHLKQGPTSNILTFGPCKNNHPEAANSFHSLLSVPPSLSQYDFQRQLNAHTSGGGCRSDTSAHGNVGAIPNWPSLQNSANFNARVDVFPTFPSRFTMDMDNGRSRGLSNDFDALRSLVTHGGSKNGIGINSSFQKGVACVSSSSNPVPTASLQAPSFVSEKQISDENECPRVCCLGACGDLLLSSTGLFGVVCSCHGMRMSVSRFCEHAGLSDVNPGYGVRMDNGETIAQWRKEYLQKFGITAPGDHRGWDWAEGLLTTSGLTNNSMAVADKRKVFDLSSLFNSSTESVKTTLPWKNLSSSRQQSSQENSNQTLKDTQRESGHDHFSTGSSTWISKTITDYPRVVCPPFRNLSPSLPIGKEERGSDCQSKSFNYIPSHGNAYSSCQKLPSFSSKTHNNNKDDNIDSGNFSSGIELKLGQSWGSETSAPSAVRSHTTGDQRTIVQEKPTHNLANAKVTKHGKQHIFCHSVSNFNRTIEPFEVGPLIKGPISFQATPFNNALTSFPVAPLNVQSFANGTAQEDHVKDGLHHSHAISTPSSSTNSLAGDSLYYKEISKRITNSHPFRLQHQPLVDRSVLIDFACGTGDGVRNVNSDTIALPNNKDACMDATCGRKDIMLGSLTSSGGYAKKTESSRFTRNGTCNPNTSVLPTAKFKPLGVANMLSGVSGATEHVGKACNLTPSIGFSPLSAVLASDHGPVSCSKHVEGINSHVSVESSRRLHVLKNVEISLKEKPIDGSLVFNEPPKIHSDERQGNRNNPDLQKLFIDQGPLRRKRPPYSVEHISSSFFPEACHKKGMSLGAITEEMKSLPELTDKYIDDHCHTQPKQTSSPSGQENTKCECDMVKSFLDRCKNNVQTMCSKMEQDCNGSSPIYGLKKQENFAGVETPKHSGSKLAEKETFLAYSQKDKNHALTLDCTNSQWIDASSKAISVSRMRCTDLPTLLLGTGAEPVASSKELSAEGTPRLNKATELLKERELSDISSDCTVLAVTHASNEVNIIDQGSAISRSCSSVEAIDSVKSSQLGCDDKTISAEEESLMLDNIAHHSIIDEFQQTHSKSNELHNFMVSGGDSGEMFNRDENEKGFKPRKRKRTTKWKMLEASFTIADVSQLPSESCVCAGNGSNHHASSSEDGQVLLQPYQNSSRMVAVNSSNDSLKHQRSAMFSGKMLSRKRDLNGMYNSVTGKPGDQRPLNKNDDFIDMPESPVVNKCKQVKLDETVRRQTKTTEAAKEYWLDNRMSDAAFQKVKPIACGKYGILCDQESDIDMIKPPKIVPLSQVLKTSKRHAKSDKARVVRSKRKKNNLHCIGGTKYLDSSCNSRRAQGSLYYKVQSGHLRAIDKSTLETQQIDLDNTHIDDPPVPKDVGHCEGERKFSVSTRQSADLSKSKEARMCSLYELSIKGNKVISADINRSQRVMGVESTVSESTVHGERAGESRDSNRRSCRKQKCGSVMSKMDELCCVCGISNKDNANWLLECGHCLIRIHQACYGISRAPKGEWYCRPCRTSSKDVACVLCGYGGGAMTRAFGSRYVVKSLLKAWGIRTEPHIMSMGSAEALYVPAKMECQNDLESATYELCPSVKPVVHNSIISGLFDPTVKQWLHMVCGLWTPGTRCPNVDTMSAFDVSGVSILREHVVCYLCKRAGGSCIKCRVETCSTQFHPWCAHQKGLLQSEVEGIDNDKVGFYGRCLLHADSEACCLKNDDADKPNSKTEREDEPTCARTQGYQGRKLGLGGHYSSYQHCARSRHLVSQVQVDAWNYIHTHKLKMNSQPKPPVADVDQDYRKEYARYKQTKGWKHLIVYKSGIHALGLYTSQFIQRGAMVVEYIGEIVGPRVADKRESEYLSGRKLQYKSACYFFRIDKEQIIDATCKGGIARFVNHSCQPNCVAKVLTVRGEKKVVFFAQRDINPGEEITYDYHFNHEDEGKKIPCFCNSKNCRRYLN